MNLLKYISSENSALNNGYFRFIDDSLSYTHGQDKRAPILNIMNLRTSGATSVALSVFRPQI